MSEQLRCVRCKRDFAEDEMAYCYLPGHDDRGYGPLCDPADAVESCYQIHQATCGDEA